MNDVIRAVVLARGLGTRMRREAEGARQTADQARMADAGLKSMIPVGRPFLDYVLSTLADAGIERVCIVVGLEHRAVRDRYTRQLAPTRLGIDFAIQPEPRGTADAVSAAEAFAGGDPFLVVNGDNHYPAQALRALAASPGPAIAAFERDELVATGNIPAARVGQFAILETTSDGFLERIVEKPDAVTMAAIAPPVLVSMNCWQFGRAIFEACRSIAPSSRGELELASAVTFAIERLGVRFRVVRATGPVLDLSTRGDIATVAARLAGADVRL